MNLQRRLSAARWRARLDGGFSIIEVSVAMTIFALVATFLSHMLASGMTGVLLGKRREVATQEANKALEIARSLSYDAVGLVSTDTTLDTDTALSTVNGVRSYRSDADWEPLIWATNPSGHPFNPHTLSVTRSSTQLTRYVYVTGVDSDSDDEVDMKRISVRVTWNESGTPGARNEVRAQTLVNESGLLPIGNGSSGGGSTSGLTPLVAKTSSDGPRIAIKSARGSLLGLLDAVLPAEPVNVQLPSTSGTSTFRAVSKTNCTAKSAALDGAASYGGHSVTVTADDDATSATPANPSPASWSGSPPDSIAALDDVDDVLFETAINSPVSCAATTEDADGAAPTDDGLPYEKGTVSSIGTSTLIEDLTGANLGTSTLNAVTMATTPGSQEIDHQTVNGNREVYANAAGSIGTTDILKIPGVFSNGLIQVEALSYGSTVRGTAGTPSAAPSVTSPTIGLRIYDAGNEVTGCGSRSSNYCIMSINPAAAGFTGRTIEFSHSVLQNLGLTELSYDIRVDILPPAKDPVAGVTGPNGEVRWSAEYTPIAVSARLRTAVTVNALLGIDVLLTDTSVDLNLGKVRAEACAGATCA